MNVDEYRASEFRSSIDNGVYLNHAASSPMPARVLSALTLAMAASAISPEQYFMEHVMPVWSGTRERVARLMGVPTADVALTRNTSQGLAIIADGLAFDAGDNVLVATCEYPSVVYPWYAQQWRGVETRMVPARPDGTFTVDDFAAHMDARTKAIAISWVQFATGFRADLAGFSDLARSRGAILVVDAIQALGVLPLNAAELGIDAVVTGSHKWLMGPHGSGGLYLSQALLGRMHPVNAGACSVVDIGKFDPLDFNLKPNAQRYEEGSPNGLGMVGLNGALSLIEEVGVEAIAVQVMSTTRHAMDALHSKGYTIDSPEEEDCRAGILMFSHAQHASDDLLQVLRQANVFASVRNGRVRFSPHFYNTTADLDAAVGALPG